VIIQCQWMDSCIQKEEEDTSPPLILICKEIPFFLTDLIGCKTFHRYIYGKQRICLSSSGSAHFHVSWLSDFIFYQKPLYKSLHQSFFLFIHNHLTLRKWCYTPLQHDFALDPKWIAVYRKKKKILHLL
jgi:hypothetical protein